MCEDGDSAVLDEDGEGQSLRDENYWKQTGVGTCPRDLCAGETTQHALKYNDTSKRVCVCNNPWNILYHEQGGIYWDDIGEGGGLTITIPTPDNPCVDSAP